MDLSTLDPTQPPSTQPVSQGDDRIRETRDAVITSFNVEHDLTGPHTFLTGAPGALPAAGFAGRIFIDTTNLRMYRDTGAAWVMLNASQMGVAFTAAAIAIAQLPTFTTVQTLSTEIVTNGRLLVVGFAEVQVAGGLAGAQARLLLDGAVPAFTPAFFQQRVDSASLINQGVFAVMFDVPAPGTRTMTLQVCGIGAATTATKRFITAIVG